MRTVNHFVNECTYLNFLPLFLLHRSSLEVRVPLIHLALIISTLEIALANIHSGCTRTFWCSGCPSMQQSGLSLSFVFMCLLYDLLSFLLHCRLCICNQHCLGWKIFYSYFSVSRGMRLCQSLVNHAWLSIPEVRWSEPHSEFILLSSQVHTWEYLVLPQIFRCYLKNFVTQIRCAAWRDTVCLLSPPKGIKWRAFLGSFHRNESLRKVVTRYRIPSFPCNIQIIEFVFASDVLAFSRFLPPHRIFLLGGVSFSKFCEIRNDSSLGTQVELSVQYGDNKWSILEQTKSIPDLLRHLLILQVETLPYRREILRWDSLSLRWIPISEWVLGIRSLFLIILLDHLP